MLRLGAICVKRLSYGQLLVLDSDNVLSSNVTVILLRSTVCSSFEMHLVNDQLTLRVIQFVLFTAFEHKLHFLKVETCINFICSLHAIPVLPTI